MEVIIGLVIGFAIGAGGVGGGTLRFAKRCFTAPYYWALFCLGKGLRQFESGLLRYA
jgi:hypothetical protein